jgi:putative Mn2+ efflux pump MntP
MGKWGKIVLYILLGVFVLIQFFRPDRNQGNDNDETDLISLLNDPDSLAL